MQIHTSDGRQDKAIEGKFNPFGKLYQLTVSPKGAESLTTKYTYSPTLEILTVTDPLNRTTRYAYDEIDRLTDVTKPDGSRQSIQYFDNANAKAITDENGNVTTYMYDGRNNLIQVRLPNYRPASYVYGALGTLLSVTDLRGLKTTFSYDANANLVSTTFPDGTQESNTYDVLGNLLSHTDPNGQTTRYNSYDSQKRPKTVSFADGTLVNYAYDAGFKGKVSAISVSGPDSQTISYTYDPFGNIIKQTKSLGNETFTLEYLYDDSGLLLKQKDPLSGNWQEFSYDSLGRLTQIQFPINGSLRPIVNDIRYNKANLMLGYALPLSNITATQVFDPQNDRIKSIAFTGPTYLSYKNQQNAAILQKMNKLNLHQFNQDPVVTGNALPYFTQTYTYDPAGNRTRLVQKEAADTTQFTYDYDRMNQLVSYAMKVNNADPVEFKYTYDSQGNRTQLMQGSTTLTTDFDTTTNKPNGYWFGAQKNDENHIEFLYDKNGNRLNKQLKTAKNELLLDITYGWNAQNRMTRYTLNGITQTNKYQFSGPRYEKKEASPEGTETTRFYPDDSLRLLSEKITDAKGQKSYAYVYLGTQKLARISKNVVTQKDEISYFLNDALGTPAWITYEHTASPNAPVLISQNRRDPWGNEMGSTLFNQTPVRDFTGKQQDTLSNLYDFGFRYYDSLLGTWIGKDLVPPDYTSPLSLNEHLYALNNPTTYVDPDGREAYKVIITAFIPYKTLSMPGLGLFHGDHRLPFQNGSSRIGQAIDIETNPKIAENPTVHYNVIVGKTIQYLDNGKTAEAVATPIFEYAISRTAANGGDNVHIDVTGHGSNPLVPFSPAIDYNFSMDITPRGNGLPPVVNLSGAHDGFPAYEVYLQNPAGNLTPVYQFLPTQSKFAPLHLLPPMDVPVNAK